MKWCRYLCCWCCLVVQQLSSQDWPGQQLASEQPERCCCCYCCCRQAQPAVQKPTAPAAQLLPAGWCCLQDDGLHRHLRSLKQQFQATNNGVRLYTCASAHQVHQAHQTNNTRQKQIGLLLHAACTTPASASLARSTHLKLSTIWQQS